ncbi:MAG: hypothetical protein GY941_26400 [Planctomycetes bacterium]|nr:hypothetical protein [Planctomycetota bacterium]
MKEAIKEVAEAVTNNPKASVIVTAAFTSNVWVDLGLPIIQGITSIAGMFVLVFLALKHATDLYKMWKKEE